MTLSPLRRLVVMALALALAAAAAFGWAASGAVEARLEARVARALDGAAADWAAAQVDGMTIRLEGRAPDPSAADAARAALAAAAPGAVLRDATTLAPTTGPETGGAAASLDILIGADGATLTGAAPDRATKRRLLAAIESRVGLAVLDLATALDGDAGPGWAAAEQAALTGAAALEHGRIALAPGAVTIRGLPADAAARETLEGAARDAAAQGVEIALDLVAPPDPAPPVVHAPSQAEQRPAASAEAAAPDAGSTSPLDSRVAAAPPPEAAVWLRARMTPDLVTLTGAAPDLATRRAALSFAAAAFGGGRVHDGLAVADAPAPEGWRAAALAALDALAKLEEGFAEAAAGRVRVEGTTLDQAAVRGVAGALAAAEAVSWRTASRIRVDLPRRAAALRVPPAECARRLTDIAAADPIRFAPNEAAIEDDSAGVLDALVAFLPRCAERAAIEVGGHTDSQGSEDYNMRLSRARAEAVRDAMIARGASPSRIAARGYGESRPIADNDTEEGRARNRRIAFTVIDETASAEAARSTGSVAVDGAEDTDAEGVATPAPRPAADAAQEDAP